jgi:uncharacterized secreted protein with C-terminal beta-propeller domain
MRATVLVVAAVVAAGVIPATSTAVAAPEEPTAACPAGVPSAGFSDVAATSVHAAAIDCVAWWDVARGADRTRFDPAGAVTRGQMASFLARAVRRSGGELAASPGDRFADDVHSAHHFSINRLAQAGIVHGRDGEFAPDAPVTRAQMAAFLVRTYEQRTGEELPSRPDAFSDDDASVHEDAIDKAAAAGLARGTGDGRYSPDAPVLRGQMAAFLARTLEAVVRTGEVSQTPADRRRASALSTADSCEPLLGHLKERGVEQVGVSGWHSGGVHWGGALPVPTSGEAAAPDGGGRASGPAFSGTNNQEAGVDEPDLAKTDGETIWSVVDGRLRAVDLRADLPRLAGTLELPEGFGHELLVHGDVALVTSVDHGYRESAPPETTQAQPSAVLTWVDVTDPDALQITGVLRVDGHAVDARMVDGVARIVVRSSAPDLGFAWPTDGSAQAMTAAAQHNRLAVEGSSIEDWLPEYVLDDHRSGGVTRGHLYGCEGLRLPPEHSGLATVNVFAVDLAQPAQPSRATGVLGDGETVYASAESVYVATSRWGSGADPLGELTPTTEVHAFSFADAAGPVYRGSGKVEGVVLNQFSMSEHEGALRVATTAGPLWWGGGEELPPTESSISVLREEGGVLTELGRVGGLGRGEHIHAVRFLGDTAYVVTFRRTDPLYRVDLSDPTAPRVTGELKIPGYSAYLHPISDDLLLGVGQDATEDGRVTGGQLSLFDVSDPAAPRRLHTASLGEQTYSEVEHDHRAFLYWPSTGTLVLPAQRWRHDEATGTDDVFVGALGFQVEPAAGFRSLGEISHGHPDLGGEERSAWPAIRRTVVVGGTAYTLSARGLMGSDVATLRQQSWVEFPYEPRG